MVTAILQLLVAGIGTGSIYALIALGFNVVFKSTGRDEFRAGRMGGDGRHDFGAAVLGIRAISGLPAWSRC